MSALTDVLFAHAMETTTETWWGDWRCICGHEGRIENGPDMSRTLKGLEVRRAHAAHVEAETAKSRLAVVKLPEAELDCTNPTFDAGCGAITHAEPNGDVRLHSVAWEPGRFGGVFRSPDKASELAAALLAAAKAAKS